eukprot:jgi/Phyca11/101056/e_gw1.5.1294.1
MTLNDFIADLEGREQFEEGDLAILVWWINDGLEKYRHAAAYDAGNGGTSRSRERTRADRKIPQDVIDCIPVRDNKEVCLHFLSKRGCNSKDPHI